MTTRIQVPADTASRSVGADEVAAALLGEARHRGLDVEVVRTGSRGLLWLEPLVEVLRPDGSSTGYGPVSAHDVPALLDAGLVSDDAARDHSAFLGVVDDLPWLAEQRRILFARTGRTVPVDVAVYEAHGGLTGLRVALASSPEEILDRVTTSGLRGRGGAGFPAGVKWRTARDTPADRRYVCANADEGDSGSFADRMLLEGDPLSLLEGMAIAGLAVGAETGIVYVRSEYPEAVATLRTGIAAARDAGMLGDDVLGSGRAFDVGVRVGAGSYVCGEETAMLESIEGRRGVVRVRPPMPARSGLYGRPTVVNNVLTLAAVPHVLAAADDVGSRDAGESLVLQLGGNVARGGIVEVPPGLRLRDLVEHFGGGTRSGRPVRAVQVGGPLGAYLPADALDVALDIAPMAEAGAMLGHGGVVVFDDTVDMAAQARYAMAFCAEESCGRCTPCRLGAVRGVEVIDRVVADVDRDANLTLLEDLCHVMSSASLCAMGGLTPNPVRSAVRHFREDFVR